MSRTGPNLNGELNGFVGEVFCADSLRLLRVLPSACIDSALIDPMYGVSKTPYAYDSIIDTFGGDPDKWWAYHEPIYSEVRRVLKRGGTLAWAMNAKFRYYFPAWFGGHRRWALSRFQKHGLNVFGHFWIVQTQDQRPIRFPDKDGDIYCLTTTKALRSLHRCPKAVEEMEFLVDALVPQGGVVLDPFCGIGTTLIAAERLGRLWIGCDLSQTYCQVAMARVTELRQTAMKEQVQSCPGFNDTGR